MRRSLALSVCTPALVVATVGCCFVTVGHLGLGGRLSARRAGSEPPRTLTPAPGPARRSLVPP